MNPETIERLLEELRPLAEKIGTGAEELFRLSVRQAYIVGWTDILIGLLLLVVSLVAARIAMRLYRNSGSYGDGEIGAILIAFGVLIAIPFGAVLLTIGIQHLLNPHYYAVQHMFKALGL